MRVTYNQVGFKALRNLFHTAPFLDEQVASLKTALVSVLGEKIPKKKMNTPN